MSAEHAETKDDESVPVEVPDVEERDPEDLTLEPDPPARPSHKRAHTPHRKRWKGIKDPPHETQNHKESAKNARDVFLAQLDDSKHFLDTLYYRVPSWCLWFARMAVFPTIIGLFLLLVLTAHIWVAQFYSQYCARSIFHSFAAMSSSVCRNALWLLQTTDTMYSNQLTSVVLHTFGWLLL